MSFHQRFYLNNPFFPSLAVPFLTSCGQNHRMFSHFFTSHWSSPPCLVRLFSHCSRAASGCEEQKGLTRMFFVLRCTERLLTTASSLWIFLHCWVSLLLFCQRLQVWCFTLVLNNHNCQPRQPQNAAALHTVEGEPPSDLIVFATVCILLNVGDTAAITTFTLLLTGCFVYADESETYEWHVELQWRNDAEVLKTNFCSVFYFFYLRCLLIFISAPSCSMRHSDKNNHTYITGSIFYFEMERDPVSRQTREDNIHAAWLNIITANDLPLHPILDCIFSIMR